MLSLHPTVQLRQRCSVCQHDIHQDPLADQIVMLEDYTARQRATVWLSMNICPACRTGIREDEVAGLVPAVARWLKEQESA